MRTIDHRYIPKVAGIDLEQSLNYINLSNVSLDFIYDKYTNSRLFYRAGSRPVLEKITAGLVANASNELAKVKILTDFVADKVKWAGYYHHDIGKKLAFDRNFSEEDLITSGYAWCNEQARVLCALTQIIGLCSRLVFICEASGKAGHVVVEVLTSNGWLLIDQSLAYLFIKNEKVIDAYQVWHNPRNRQYFSPIYKKYCNELNKKLGSKILNEEYAMSQMSEPFDGFEVLGFCNYFIH